ITVRDAKTLEIVDDSPRIIERECVVELQPVRRGRHDGRRHGRGMSTKRGAIGTPLAEQGVWVVASPQLLLRSHSALLPVAARSRYNRPNILRLRTRSNNCGLIPVMNRATSAGDSEAR